MNSYTSVQVGYTQFFADELLAALATRPAGPLIATGKLRLSIDPAYAPNSQSTVAQLATHEANYSGYTAGGLAATLVGPVNLSLTAQGIIVQGLFEATSASPFVPATVYGWWIDDGTNLIAYERFAGGQTGLFQAPGDWLALTALLPIQLNQPAA